MSIQKNKTVAHRYLEKVFHDFWQTIFRLSNCKLVEREPQLSLAPVLVERWVRVNRSQDTNRL